MTFLVVANKKAHEDQSFLSPVWTVILSLVAVGWICTNANVKSIRLSFACLQLFPNELFVRKTRLKCKMHRVIRQSNEIRNFQPIVKFLRIN